MSTPPSVPPARGQTTDGGGLDGSRLGEFRLLRVLGSGGMASVYLAEQSSLQRKVALKILRPDLLADDTYLERFAREAKTAAGLSHNNIVQVFAVGEQDGLHYIAQEFVQGVNLREFLNRKGPPEASVAVHIIRQAALALVAAADAGIVHRDIKPENILLTRQGVVKVTDFGLAQLDRESEQTNLTLTQAGTTMGTPLYMSPEQVNGSRVDHRSDIYSLGITAYHLLAGRPPFQGETAISVAVQHVNKAPESLAIQRSDLPRRLCDLVHRMIAKDPDQRVPNASILLEELEMLQQRIGSVSSGPGSDWVDYAPPLSAWKRTLGWINDVNWKTVTGALVWPAACLVFAATAGGVNILARPAGPLATAPTAPRQAPRKERPDQQFLYAIMVNTEAAWQAVIDHHPLSSLYVNQARVKLALLYLSNDRYEDARPIFEELVLAGETEPELVATGLAGRAVLASIDGHYEESQDIIAEKLVHVRDYLDPEIERLVGDTVAHNNQKSATSISRGLEDVFRRADPGEETPGEETPGESSAN